MNALARKGARAGGREVGSRHRVAVLANRVTCSPPHQGFGEVGDDPFGVAVAAGGTDSYKGATWAMLFIISFLPHAAAHVWSRLTHPPSPIRAWPFWPAAMR